MKKKKPIFKQTGFVIVLLILVFFVLLITISFLVLYNFVNQINSSALLEPAEELSPEALAKSADIIKQRLDLMALPSEVRVLENVLVADCHKDLSVNAELGDLLKKNHFEAKIGEQVIFENFEDVTYVCRYGKCAGYGLDLLKKDDLWQSRYFFAITLSDEAAKRFAEISNELGEVEEEGNLYLDEDLVFYLDGREIERLRMATELKGRETTDITISGDGQGETSEAAKGDSLREMRLMQIILMTETLPADFEIVKITTTE